jgi:riboflavin synthase
VLKSLVFTGLIEDVGEVTGAAGRSDRLVLTVRPRRLDAAALALGESVAIDGVCLTVTERGARGFEVLAGAETLERTTLGRLRPGARVNLERSLRVGDRLGGHFVQGHVDGVGKLVARRDRGANLELELRVPVELARYLVEKGSVAIDGISLTVNRVTGPVISVALIPHTAQETTLADRRVGDPVNLEVDMLAKYIEKLTAEARP